MVIKYSTVLLLIMLLACKRTDTINTGKEKNAIEKIIRGTLNSYYEDIKMKGLMAEFHYLDSSREFYWVPPGSNIALGYDSIRTLITQNSNKFKSVENNWDSLRIIVLDQDHASYTGRLNSKMIETSGQMIEIKLVESGVLIKRKDGWKLLGGQTAVINE